MNFETASKCIIDATRLIKLLGSCRL
jgi:hypothetical protein